MSKEFKVPNQIIYVCTGSKCKKKGGKEISKLFRSQIKDFGMKGQVEVIKTDCTDRCKFAPVMSFQPQNAWFHEVTESQARQLFQDQVVVGPEKKDPSGPEA